MELYAPGTEQGKAKAKAKKEATEEFGKAADQESGCEIAAGRSLLRAEVALKAKPPRDTGKEIDPWSLRKLGEEIPNMTWQLLRVKKIEEYSKRCKMSVLCDDPDPKKIVYTTVAEAVAWLIGDLCRMTDEEREKVREAADNMSYREAARARDMGRTNAIPEGGWL